MNKELFELMLTTTETIFRKLPNLKLGCPAEELKYSNPQRDVGIQELPIVF